MKIKPILFSTPMIQAILEGRKTQTRRICKIQPKEWQKYTKYKDGTFNINGPDYDSNDIFPRYQKGDILWVRETFRYAHHYGIDYEFVQYKDGSTNTHCEIPDKDQILHDDKWKPSIFMPKAACRIFLEVTNVSVERLQYISEEDAIQEGILSILSIQRVPRYIDYTGGNGDLFPKESFKTLWLSINGNEPWEANSWVWVYEFKRVEKPENFLV